MPTFAELLTQHLQRSGISDSELARSVGVSRLTVFRWKEGLVARPRQREDVLRCATKLRLNPEERDQFLLAAGFPPAEQPRIDASAVSATTASADGASGEERAVAGNDESQANQTAAVTHRHLWQRPGLPRLAVVLGVCLLLIVVAALVTNPPGWSGPLPTPTLPPVNTPAATASLAQTPSATPLQPQTSLRAPDGETWVMVARFANYAPDASFNVAGRIQEALEEQVAAASLADTRALLWPEEITNHNQAEAVVASSRAALLIWGEYDSGRVRVNFTVQGDLPDEERDLILASADELLTTINVEVPREVRSLALLTLARLYREDGNFRNMRAALERALDQQPSGEDTLATIHFYLGYAFQHGESPNLVRAIDHYSEAIDRQPAWLNARYNRGLAHLQHSYAAADALPSLIAAIADLSWVVDERPDLDKALVNRGIAYYERNQAGDLQLATADFSNAIRRRPTNHRAYYNRALASIRRGDADGWQGDLAKASELQPDFAEAYNALCWGLVLAQQPQAALDACARAAALDAPEPTRDSVGLAYAQLGRLDDAAAEFEAYLVWLATQPPQLYIRNNGALIKGWIPALHNGENPIDAAALEKLRG